MQATTIQANTIQANIVAKHSESTQSPEALYRNTAPEYHTIDDATLAVRHFGPSDAHALVFIHGFPVHGYTWRYLLPELSQRFHCIVIDLPGLGDSDWLSHTDFRFTAQARRIDKFIAQQGLTEFSLIAHDTGATIARLVALHSPDKVVDLIMFNTEMPGHRPPWIRFHQFSSYLPFARFVFRFIMQTPVIRNSALAFKPFYANQQLLRQPGMLDPYVRPLTESKKRMLGMFGYLRGIEWNVVDSLADLHGDIRARTHLIWGEQDPTFPVDRAEVMRQQFQPAAPLHRIRDAAVMPHEERPLEVLNIIESILMER